MMPGPRTGAMSVTDSHGSSGSSSNRLLFVCVENPKAIESMREIGYDLSRHRPKSLSEIPDVEYDFVATMGCGDKCPLVRAKQREDWGIPDPKEMPPDEFRAVRG